MNYIKAALIFFVISLSSCQYFNKDKAVVDMSNDPLVTVYGQTLYRADLDRLIPAHLQGEDSIKAAEEYINAWTSELVFYDKAKRNTSNSHTINQLLEDYRKDLITNSYRESILKEHFMKSLSEGHLKEYYDTNQALFKLEECIIQGLYLKIPVNSSELSNFKKWYRQTSETAVSNIEKYTLQNVVNYEYFYDKWVSFPDLMNNIPTNISDDSQFLESNAYVEVSDSSFVYLLNIKNYKLAGDQAPYEFIKDRLPEIYKERNRSEYLKKIQGDLLKKAISDEQVIFYKQN